MLGLFVWPFCCRSTSVERMSRLGKICPTSPMSRKAQTSPLRRDERMSALPCLKLESCRSALSNEAAARRPDERRAGMRLQRSIADCRHCPTKPPKTEQPKGPTKAKARIPFECVDSIQYEAFHSAMSKVATRRARSNSTSLFLSLAEQSARLFFALP
jgi:hypothetical protein